MTTPAGRSRGMPRRRAPITPRPSRAPLVVGVLLLALVALAAVAAVALSSTSSGGLDEPARRAVVIEGSALPAFTDPADDPAVGQPVPILSGTGLDGEPLRIGAGQGPMAIVLLAHWCSHCQAEVPVLVEYLASKGMPPGVRLVGLSSSIDPTRPNYPPSAWLEREGWSVPTLVDDASSRALAALGMTSFPGFVFVDADGRVVQRFTGEMRAATFEQAVRALAP